MMGIQVVLIGHWRAHRHVIYCILCAHGSWRVNFVSRLHVWSSYAFHGKLPWGKDIDGRFARQFCGRWRFWPPRTRRLAFSLSVWPRFRTIGRVPTSRRWWCYVQDNAPPKKDLWPKRNRWKTLDTVDPSCLPVSARRTRVQTMPMASSNWCRVWISNWNRKGEIESDKKRTFSGWLPPNTHAFWALSPSSSAVPFSPMKTLRLA